MSDMADARHDARRPRTESEDGVVMGRGLSADSRQTVEIVLDHMERPTSALHLTRVTLAV